MGELYNPYPKLPKNIRQIGERDQIVKLYVEDYVNIYLKRLYPVGGQDLRVGLLLGEVRSQDGMPYLFADGAMEMEEVTQDGEKVLFTEDAWKRAYQTIEQMFPKRSVIGWFLCGAPACSLSPLNYWKQHGQYFPGKNQLMYLNGGLEGEETVYISSDDGFYKLRGHCIYYERNQMMQDYMVSRKDVRRVESGVRDVVIRDFRQRMEDKKLEAKQRSSTINVLGTACSVLAVLVLAGGVVMSNNYHKMKTMESVIASVVPEGTAVKWSSALSKGGFDTEEAGDSDYEVVAGEVYPTKAEIVIDPATNPATDPATDPVGQPAAAAGTQSVAAEPQTPPQTQAPQTQVPQESIPQAQTQAAASIQIEAPAVPVQVPSDAIRYQVKDGETLYGICIERYQNLKHLEEICLWNQLSDQNRIAAGQELLLPPS